MEETIQLGGVDISGAEIDKPLLRGKRPSHFSNLRGYGLTLSVQLEKKSLCGDGEVRTKTIIEDVSISVSPGEMVAIMGPSGAGKTTVVKILGKRNLPTNGWVALGDHQLPAATFRRCLGYVAQHCLLDPSLTVWELMKFYADMRLSDLTNQQKADRISEVLSELGLCKVQETIIGRPEQEGGGLSGGERKRLSIAVEMLPNPQFLLLDEPTSGLDASTAMSLCETLSTLCKNSNKSCLYTIHQPRHEIFCLFDKLLILAKGRVAYYGTTPKSIEWFESQGYPLPPYISQSDHVIDCVTSGQFRTEEQVEGLLQAWEKYQNKNDFLAHPEKIEEIEPPNMRQKKWYQKKNDEETPLMVEEKQDLELLLKNESRAGWFTQLMTLLKRDYTVMFREPLALKVKVIRALFTSLLIGLVFFQLGDDQNSIRSIAGVIGFIAIATGFTVTTDGVLVFQQSRMYYSRDLAVSLYDASSFYASTLLVHLPTIGVISLIQLSIMYWMIGLKDEFGAFLIFLLFQGVLFLLCVSFGFFVSVAAPSITAATAIAPITLSFFTMFGGNFLSDSDIPVWLIWAKWISPLRAVYVACFINEFEDTTWSCSNGDDTVGPAFCLSTGSEIISYYGYDDVSQWNQLALLIGEFLFCVIATYFLLVWKESKTYPK